MKYEDFTGGCTRHESFAGNIELSGVAKRCIYLNPVASGLQVTLPPVTTRRTGGPHFYLINGSSDILGVVDYETTFSIDIAPSKVRLVHMSVNNTWTISNEFDLRKVVT